MKEIELTSLDIKLYTEKLDNGLEVYMLPYKDKKKYFISYATRYGSDVLKFDVDGEEYAPPLGVAHYLEHKLFEEESGIDPFTFFSESGTDGNASTSYDYTQYICYGTKKFDENLRYLVQFVNRPYFTDENVLKEKGIISEEIKMYNDIPDYKLEIKLREMIYNSLSRKYDIAGTIDEINKITKEDLYKCYNSFYVPNNMFILIVGNFDCKSAINIIKEELDSKISVNLPKIHNVNENDKVNKKELIIKEDIEVPKIGIGLKVPSKNLKLNDVELDLYLNMITTILFGSSSEFRERVRVEELLNDIYSEWESTDNFKTFYLYATSKYPDKLVEEINYEFDNLSVTTTAFNRIKKVWIANEVKTVDNVYRMENNVYDDIISYGKPIANRVELIRNMDIKVLRNLIKKIKFDNRCILKMYSKDKKKL